MSINEIIGSSQGAAQFRNTPGVAGDARAVRAEKIAQQPKPAAPSVASAESALPAAAPEGTDPALWSVLTTEERAFYARVRSLGPLTYSPGQAAEKQPMPRGGRLNVSV